MTSRIACNTGLITHCNWGQFHSGKSIASRKNNLSIICVTEWNTWLINWYGQTHLKKMCTSPFVWLYDASFPPNWNSGCYMQPQVKPPCYRKWCYLPTISKVALWCFTIRPLVVVNNVNSFHLGNALALVIHICCF